MITSIERLGTRVALACALATVAACSSAGTYVWVHDRKPDPLPAHDGGRVVIGPGDLIDVQVYGDEDASSTGRVLGDGTLSLPLLGPVAVAGKRPEELAAQLEEQLKKYIAVPRVTVWIREAVVSVSVLGEVRQPGVVDLVAPAPVLEGLAKAGGLTEFADSSRIFVLRAQADGTERIRFTYTALVQAERAASQFQLKTGDVLVVE